MRWSQGGLWAAWKVMGSVKVNQWRPPAAGHRAGLDRPAVAGDGGFQRRRRERPSEERVRV
jgi:hypothetical protein